MAKPGDVATHPEAIYNNNTLVNKPSSRYLEDASYVKLRSLRIGYNFPASLAEKIWVKNASIYIMGENLFTITKFSGVDPEVGAYGSRDLTLILLLVEIIPEMLMLFIRFQDVFL